MGILSQDIFQIEPSEDPLSADVILVRGEHFDWVFDVGAGAEAAQTLREWSRPYRVILSHFHADHIGNLTRISPENVYQGKFTFQKTKIGTIVSRITEFYDGRKIRILPFPSSHAKDSLALEVDGAYLFTGDGTDCTVKNGRMVYNAGTLQQTIRTIEESPAYWIGLSHETPFLQPKEEVVAKLEAIYRRRNKQDPYISMDE